MENEAQNQSGERTESPRPAQEQAHTPLPWYADVGERLSDGSDCWVIDSESGSIAEMMCAADVEEVNARLMARAVNTHETLITALRRIALIAGNLSDEAVEGVGGIHDARSRAFMVTQARRLAVNALALAGEPVASEQKG